MHWNLLLLAVSSLTISVTVLLWFLGDLLGMLRRPELPTSRRQVRVVATSTRALVLVVGVLLSLFGSALASIVTLRNLTGLGVSLWSSEFFLLCVCLAIPLGGGLAALLLIAQNIKAMDLRIAAQRLMMFAWQRPLLLNVEGLVKSEQAPNAESLLPPWQVEKDWRAVEKWVELQGSSWGLGRGFLRANREALLGLARRALFEVEASGGGTDRFVEQLASLMEVTLERGQAFDALIMGRPTSIAKAAAVMLLDDKESTE